MTTNQLDFFGRCFEQINNGKSSIILLDHNGNILSQLTESEGSLTDRFSSLEIDDYLYLLEHWAYTKEIIENQINSATSIKQIENKMIETSSQLSDTEGLVLLSKSELSTKLNGNFRAVVPKRAHSR